MAIIPPLPLTIPSILREETTSPAFPGGRFSAGELLACALFRSASNGSRRATGAFSAAGGLPDTALAGAFSVAGGFPDTGLAGGFGAAGGLIASGAVFACGFAFAGALAVFLIGSEAGF